MSEPVIVANDVSIGWSADAHLVDHATFEVQRGEVFGILGRSASGKSTLMRALIGLDMPLAGTLRVQGQEPGMTFERPTFGVMFQQGALIGSSTVGENIALPLKMWTDLPKEAIRAVVHAKLRLVGLAHAIDLTPAELSGGMRKRAAIARALALDPSLVFLDEPSSGLDPITSAEIDHLIRTLADHHELTVVLVTHELSSIERIVDRCIMLDHIAKRIAASGTPRELAENPDPTVHHFFTRTAEAA